MNTTPSLIASMNAERGFRSRPASQTWPPGSVAARCDAPAVAQAGILIGAQGRVFPATTSLVELGAKAFRRYGPAVFSVAAIVSS